MAACAVEVCVIVLVVIPVCDVMLSSAVYVDAPVVVDGNMITSRFPKDLPDFCKAVLAQLA